jgi:integrase
MAAPSVDDLAHSFERYVRAGNKSPPDHHRLAHLDALWLSPRGALTISGLRDLLDRRARQAGILDLHPHRFRHTFARVAQRRRDRGRPDAYRWLAVPGDAPPLRRLDVVPALVDLEVAVPTPAASV